VAEVGVRVRVRVRGMRLCTVLCGRVRVRVVVRVRGVCLQCCVAEVMVRRVKEGPLEMCVLLDHAYVSFNPATCVASSA
jgi:hypothetical protein